MASESAGVRGTRGLVTITRSRPAGADFEGGRLRWLPGGGRGASVLRAGARDSLGPRLEDEALDDERDPEVQQQGPPLLRVISDDHGAAVAPGDVPVGQVDQR